MIPGAILIPGENGRLALRFSRVGRTGCPPQFYIDGIQATGFTIDDMPPGDVEGRRALRRRIRPSARIQPDAQHARSAARSSSGRAFPGNDTRQNLERLSAPRVAFRQRRHPLRSGILMHRLLPFVALSRGRFGLSSSRLPLRRGPRARAPPSADLIVTNARIYTVDDSHPFVCGHGRARRPRAVRRLGARSAAPARRVDASDRRRRARRSSPAWSTRTATSFELGDVAPQHRSHRHALVRRRRRAGRGPSQGRAGQPLGRRPRLGPEQVGRHALSHARGAVAHLAEQSRRPRARRRARASSPTPRRCAPPASPRQRRRPPAAASSTTRTASPPACSSTTRWSSINRVIPPPSHDEMRSATLAAIAEANRYGLVGMHDAGEPREVIDVFEELAQGGNVQSPRLRHDRATTAPRSSTTSSAVRRARSTTAISGFAPSSSTPTARSARAAPRCSTRTPTTRRTTACSSPRRSTCATSRRARCSTAFRWPRTPSATAATASRSTRTRRRSRPCRRSITVSASSTCRSSITPTCRASRSSA